MRDEACGKCRFWGLSADDREQGCRRGPCRRYAPRAAVLPYGEADDCDYAEFPVWPITHEEEWCGEFEAAALPVPPTDAK